MLIPTCTLIFEQIKGKLNFQISVYCIHTSYEFKIANLKGVSWPFVGVIFR